MSKRLREILGYWMYERCNIDQAITAIEKDYVPRDEYAREKASMSKHIFHLNAELKALKERKVSVEDIRDILDEAFPLNAKTDNYSFNENVAQAIYKLINGGTE